MRDVGAAIMVALLGFASATSCDPPLGACEDSSCSSEGEVSCRDNEVMSCTLYEGDPCTYYYLTAVEDCDSFAEGARCESGECVLTNERCPAGVSAFCRDETLFRCQGSSVLARSRDCTFQDDNRCWDSSNGGPPDGVCALEPVRCRSAGAYSSECRGDERVVCHDGYPVEVITCNGVDEHCREVGSPDDRAQCVPDIMCPPEGGTVCDFGQLYGCEPDAAPELLRDCRPILGTCDVVNGRSLCSSSDPFPTAFFRAVPGGTFDMGPADDPVGPFSVLDFEMLDQEVTVGDYSACMLEGYCTAPDDTCVAENSRRPDLDANLPVTCVTKEQAATYCGVLGGRLPIEYEWEYAFRNGGDDIPFPWGDGPANCDYAVLDDPPNGGAGCGHGEPWSGCSTSSDRTEHGLCDLAGNVREWVMSPVTSVESGTRGGAFDDASVNGRVSYESAGPAGNIGFRCVR